MRGIFWHKPRRCRKNGTVAQPDIPFLRIVLFFSFQDTEGREMTAQGYSGTDRRGSDSKKKVFAHFSAYKLSANRRFIIFAVNML